DLAGATWDQDHVGSGNILDRGVGQQPEHAVVRAELSGLGCDELKGRVGQPAQDLVGADGVERGDAVIEKDGDVHGRLLVGGVQAAARESAPAWRSAARERKRRRYSAGPTSRARRKERRIVSGVPK